MNLIGFCDGSGHDACRTVEITASGWRLVEGKPPVRFIRAPGVLPLPVPQPGGRIDVSFSKARKRLIQLGRISDGSDAVSAPPAADRPSDKALPDNDLPLSQDGMDGLDGVAPTFSEAEVEFSDEVIL